MRHNVEKAAEAADSTDMLMFSFSLVPHPSLWLEDLPNGRSHVLREGAAEPLMSVRDLSDHPPTHARDSEEHDGDRNQASGAHRKDVLMLLWRVLGCFHCWKAIIYILLKAGRYIDRRCRVHGNLRLNVFSMGKSVLKAGKVYRLYLACTFSQPRIGTKGNLSCC